MAIDFPDSPTDGQSFTSGATKWIYSSSESKWNIAAPDTATTTAFAPIGTVINYMGGAAPNGWLLCNGQSLTRSAYPALFGVLSTTYGQGSNPGTTFALPQFMGTTGIYIIRATDEAVTLSSASNLLAMPVGTMSLFAMSTIPTGWLRCDGSAVSRTSYADLYSAVGTTYGTGDGSTTFNLPNIAGSGSGSPLYYIKAILSGDAAPASVAHASSHIRTGSDVIDGDRLQVDYVPSAYTRDSTDANAGANTDLTAHLKGINTAISATYSRSQMPTGSVINTAYGQKTDYSTYTSGTFTDIGLSCTLNVSLASSVVLIQVSIPTFIKIDSGTTWGGGFRLVTSTGTTITDTAGDNGGPLGFWINLQGLGGSGYRDAFTTVPMHGVHIPGATGSVTYKVQVSVRSGGVNVNYNASNYFPKSTIIAQEIKQ
jgi:microcystin-dependent protein